MSGTWIVVADSSRARFFTLESRTEPLSEHDGLVHMEGRMREQDEVSDRQGGIAGGHGEGDHTFEAPTDIKHHEAAVFAKQIADNWSRAVSNHDLNKLILVAPPAFLGALRLALNQHVLKLIRSSLDKNLVAEDEP